ncbi:YecA family protein [Aeromonas veronii]|uniref:YecA family protein n=1 Tax=Aeromonas veronii TaxID=654 RepID=UPI003D1A92C1
MLEPIIKEAGINDSERYLATLSEKTFLSLWCYPNVYTDEGYSKSKNGKELCDLLVVFENKIIIFSDKNIAFNQSKDIEVAWKRWFKRSILESASQLFGAESWIKNHSDRIFLDKKCENKLPISIPKNGLEIFLIAVTKNSSGPAKKHYNSFAEGSTGTLVQNYDMSLEQCLDNPFNISDLFPSKTFIHILDEISLDLLISKLDTIHDFTTYLTEKERAIRNKHLRIVYGEEDLLGYFYSNIAKDLTGRIELPSQGASYRYVIQEGFWDSFIKSDEYILLESYRKGSVYWDELISIFSEHILGASVYHGKENSFESHEATLKYMASENRLSRYRLCYSFLMKFNSVPHNARSSLVMESPQHEGRLYTFLFFPRSENMSDSEYRECRLGAAFAYSIVVKYQHPKAKDVIVIATETRQNKTRSEDIIARHYDKQLSTDEKREARDIMKEFQVLTNTNPKNPPVYYETPYINNNKEIGRNDKCSCGSGKKFKKCCMQNMDDY